MDAADRIFIAGCESFCDLQRLGILALERVINFRSLPVSCGLIGESSGFQGPDSSMSGYNEAGEPPNLTH